MKEVFFLGAGFSKAINASMPTLEELSLQVKERLNGNETFPPPLLDLGNNIELWLTYLSQFQPWLKEQYNLNNKALFLTIIEELGKIIQAATDKAISENQPVWLDQLVKYWHENRCAVISLNYDTLIESASLKRGMSFSSFYPVAFPDIQRDMLYPCAEKKPTFMLFKLHGSINWYYSGASEYFGEVIYRGNVGVWESKTASSQILSRSAAQDKHPLIVPPTSEKSYYLNHEAIRLIWLKASAALSAAEALYMIGYSLPATDLGIRFFLQHGRPANPIPLFIVNKDRNCVEHYESLLGDSYVINNTYAVSGVEEMIKRII